VQLSELFQNPLTTDVVFNGAAGFELVAGRWLPVDSRSDEQVAALAVELCEAGGRRIDLSMPFADVSVEGFRVHAVLPAGVSAVPLLSIRKHNSRVVPLTRELQEIVESRQNFLVSGATGAGKTTLLRSMLGGLNDRVICIEDVGELGFAGSNYVSLVSRPPNIEGVGELSLERLFREALRMRPDRIVLGEVRGAEFGLLLQALNTGHSGSGATIHANSAKAVISRLLGLGLQSGLTAQATLALAKTAIEKVIHVSPSGIQVSSLGELVD
jgi:pilus assembly protein CpaF